jgi:hypothetical protein
MHFTDEEYAETAAFHQRSMKLAQENEEPDAQYTTHTSLFPVLAALRVSARAHGYAVAYHGSLSRDIDVIAVPWKDMVSPPRVFVADVVKRTGGWLRAKDNCPTARPHGRLAWSIHIIGTGTYIDLSVMPPTTPAPGGGA